MTAFMTTFVTKASAVEFLLPIWQRVLQRSSVQTKDNFFDLGGSPASALQLFSEVADVCGRHLAAVLIYSAPTIEALMTKDFTYAQSMGSFAAVVLVVCMIVIAAGPEAHRVAFGQNG